MNREYKNLHHLLDSYLLSFSSHIENISRIEVKLSIKLGLGLEGVPLIIFLGRLPLGIGVLLSINSIGGGGLLHTRGVAN